MSGVGLAGQKTHKTQKKQRRTNKRSHCSFPGVFPYHPQVHWLAHSAHPRLHPGSPAQGQGRHLQLDLAGSHSPPNAFPLDIFYQNLPILENKVLELKLAQSFSPTAKLSKLCGQGCLVLIIMSVTSTLSLPCMVPVPGVRYAR